ncbi:hypothetical protein BGX26_010394 [Mortierella sp. AD094]|nr:hypothetical protein BGX26_010394 [Mortierella sp. AD094]
MTAPASTNDRACNDTVGALRPNSAANSNGREKESNGNGASHSDQSERSPRQRETRPDSAREDNEHPELDDFVNGFYDGDKFTDVDSRVWA